MNYTLKNFISISIVVLTYSKEHLMIKRNFVGSGKVYSEAVEVNKKNE